MDAWVIIWAGAALAVLFLVRANQKRKRQESQSLEPSETNVTLDLLLEEAEKTNELLRQLIRSKGEEPEA